MVSAKALFMTFLFSFGLAFEASADVYFHDFRAWKWARVIPAGQQVWGFQTAYQKTGERFANDGSVQPLGQGFTRPITWGRLLAETSGQDRRDLERLMARQGAKDADVVATAEYGVVREDTTFKVEWAYGIMPRWMVGFDVPITHRKTSVNTRLQTTRPLPSFRSQDVSEKLKEITLRELANSGYDDIPSETSDWLWGDMTLLSQVVAVSGYSWQTALRQFVRFPTARNPSLDEYIQVSDDTGQIDVGLSALADYRHRSFTLGLEGGHIIQLPDTLRARVSGDQETRQVDPNVRRDLGDYSFGSVNMDIKLQPRTGLLVEYSYLYKTADRYAGESAEGPDYAALGRDTEQDLHETRVGLRYDFLYEGRRGGIADAWSATLAYNQPWAGHNSNRAGRATLDVLRYF